MLALSLYQPHAGLVVGGFKGYETRSWHTLIRGWVVIHSSGGTVPRPGRELMRSPHYRRIADYTGVNINNFTCGPGGLLPTRCFIGFARIEACQKTQAILPMITQHEQAFGDWAPDRFAWRLAEPIQLLHNVPADGRQRFFGVKPKQATDLLEALLFSGLDLEKDSRADLVAQLRRAELG